MFALSSTRYVIHVCMFWLQTPLEQTLNGNSHFMKMIDGPIIVSACVAIQRYLYDNTFISKLQRIFSSFGIQQLQIDEGKVKYCITNLDIKIF